MARDFMLERREAVAAVVYDCGLLLIEIRVVDCCSLFTLCDYVSSVLHSHAGIWKRQVASFIFEPVLHLKTMGIEGKSKGKSIVMCVWVGLRVGNRVGKIAESARR